MEPLLHLVWQYALPFVLVLSIVVFVHEFGHYWVARRCGVKVETFSIGFGPEIFGFHDRSGTRWKFSLLPLGGYVKMFGDADPASTTDPEARKNFTPEERAVAFFAKSVERRAAVVVAGPVANYIFAILVLAGLFIFSGQPYSAPVVGQIMENSAAAESGLKVDDRIARVGDQTIERFEEIQQIVAINRGEPLRLEILRDGQPQNLTVTPKLIRTTDVFGNEHTTARIGIARAGVEYRKHPPLEAIQAAAEETWNVTSGTLKAIGQMFAGTRSTEELGGPLRIAQMSGEMTHSGITAFFWFIAVLSINLGLLNLFPIPLLDGGHLVFYAFEKLRGRPLSEKMQEAGARVGITLVLALMLFSTWNDLVQLRIVAAIRGLFS